jgi:hypothetical protein
MTYEPLPQNDLPQMELELMSSAEDSLAKISALPEKVRDWKASAAAYGRNTPELLANYDRNSSSWRTSQRCLVEGWTVFSETWPRSGLMRNGIAYQLQPLVRLTDEIGSGLLLTGKRTHHVPTPTASDHITRKCTSTEALNFNTNKSVSLDRWVGMWPTPTINGNYNRKGASKTSGDGLATAIGGSLNPTWVEWLMGFSLGWTDLKD